MKFRKEDPFEPVSQISTRGRAGALEWEEAALSNPDHEQEVFDKERLSPAFLWVRLVLLAVFAVLLFRVFSLQVVQGSYFRKMSENNRIRSQTLLAPRGLVYDRNGQILVQNSVSYNLAAVPFDIRPEALDSQLNNLVQLFGLDKAEAERKIKAAHSKSLDPVILRNDLSQDQAVLFETRSEEFAGFVMNKVPVRQYLNPEAYAHVLGYTGVINSEERQKLDKDLYDNNDFVGKSGIELMYEHALHGNNGQVLVEVDAMGHLLNLLGEKSPKPGQAIELNLDNGLQIELYNALKSRNKNVKAAAVALNPKTGEVLAFLSLPGFDGNAFARGISSKDYQALLSDPNLPLFNRVIAGTYPPGSTVKPMVAAAALNEKVVTAKTIIVDRGVLVIPHQYDPSISYNFVGWKRDGLGPMDIKSAIAQSSDIYFYVVGGGHPSSQVKGLGPDKLADYYRKFNLGQTTGIDLQGEKSGVVADPNWKANYYEDDQILGQWYLGDTYHISIGQGDMLTTPLQVAQFTAIIANNGVGMKPKILKKILGGKDFQPEVSVQKFLSDDILHLVQEGMRETVLSGSGRQLNTLSITAAGKTGTSQFDGSDPKRTHAWFTAYAPYEDPQIVITVLVEAGGEGHAVAVPVVKQALEWWAENRGSK
jgi:penicillin-binding protein 2